MEERIFSELGERSVLFLCGFQNGVAEKVCDKRVVGFIERRCSDASQCIEHPFFTKSRFDRCDPCILQRRKAKQSNRFLFVARMARNEGEKHRLWLMLLEYFQEKETDRTTQWMSRRVYAVGSISM